MKKIISIVLSLLMLLPTICSAKDITAKNSMYVYTDSIPSSVTDFLSNNLPLLLDTVKENPTMYKIDENIIDSLYVGNGFNSFQYNNDTLENNNVYFFPLLYNGKIKAIVNIGFDGQKIIGASLSTSLSEKLDNLQNSRKTNKPYILIRDNNSLLIKNENYTLNLAEGFMKSQKVSANYNYLDTCASDELIKKMKGKIIESENITEKDENIVMKSSISSEFLPNDYILNSTYPSSKYLNIPIVSQWDGNTYYGICWAAVVASITNYKTGTSLTAKQVCDDLDRDYDGGSLITSKVAYLHYGLYTDIINRQLTSTEIVDNISNDKPVDVTLESEDGNTMHTVALRAYNISSSGMALSVMDPYTARYQAMICNYNNGNLYCMYLDGIPCYWVDSITLR